MLTLMIIIIIMKMTMMKSQTAQTQWHCADFKMNVIRKLFIVEKCYVKLIKKRVWKNWNEFEWGEFHSFYGNDGWWMWKEKVEIDD